METSTQAESSREGRKCTREANRLLANAQEEKAMQVSLERELELHVDEEFLAPKVVGS